MNEATGRRQHAAGRLWARPVATVLRADPRGASRVRLLAPGGSAHGVAVTAGRPA